MMLERHSLLELRPFNDDDVSLAEKWLNKKHVKRWYEMPHLGITINDWLSEINGRNGDFQWLTYFVATWQDHPIGLCQYYKCVDSDEDFGTLPLTGSYGIDYLIGEESFLGKGLGRGMIALLVERIFTLPDAQRVTADIDRENRPSEKSLLSCGFSLLDVERSRYVMRKSECADDSSPRERMSNS